jgi:AcrR family transcriptional regulator
MSPRPRKASDAEVFAAAARVMSRVGPTELTLALIAGEAGLTAGALVQRFGSKRGLMVALSSEWSSGTPTLFAQLRAANKSPLETVRAYADCIARMGTSPRALAHHLSYLQVDITDPQLRRHLRTQARAARAAIRELLVEGVNAGELIPTADTAMLAKGIEVAISGSLMTWACYQEGSATAWMRDDVNAVLRPWLPTTKKRTSRAAKTPRRASVRR